MTDLQIDAQVNGLPGNTVELAATADGMGFDGFRSNETARERIAFHASTPSYKHGPTTDGWRQGKGSTRSVGRTVGTR